MIDNPKAEEAHSSTVAHFDPVMHFPPCFSEEQMIVSELMIFGILPNVKSFIRDVTEFERANGLADAESGMDSVLVTRDGDRGPQRKYGIAISLEDVSVI